VANPVDTAAEGGLESLSLVELAVSRLRREILGGSTDPGQRLVEEQLTRRMGISRGPLREALRRLAEQGLVEHLPRRGVRVATLSAADVQELYEVREVLERHAVTLGGAAPHRPDLAELRAALDAMRAAARAGDRLGVADAHRRFHVGIVALGGNRQLALLYESVLVRLQLYMAVNLRREAEEARPMDGVHRHERLLQAVRGGSAGTVLDALSHHGARDYLDR
jgi:DNA-binding GntR family transcriptional regulator